MLLEKKGKKVLPSGSGTSEASRSSVFPLSLLSPAVSRRVEPDGGRFESWLIQSRRGGGLDPVWRHLSRVQKKIGADLEVSVARSEKGDLEQGKEEAMKASAVRASLLSNRAVAEAAWGSRDAHVQSTAHIN